MEFIDEILFPNQIDFAENVDCIIEQKLIRFSSKTEKTTTKCTLYMKEDCETKTC